ncbi:hypothetical protein CB1_000949002 [Camelus ferus]|nr:hypothetical protein CB1_000949002 [Camelus ferus]
MERRRLSFSCLQLPSAAFRKMCQTSTLFGDALVKFLLWLVDNFCVCEGCSVPRCLMYEMYVETYGQDAQNQVNPAMFGKLAFLADKYCGYCQDVLQNVRNQDLEKVEDSLTSFWKSLQQDTVMLLSLPDVCQLFKCYDVQLYKGIEDVLLRDFLEDVSLQYLKSVRLFSKKFKLWLLTALEGFPALLQISKLKDVTVFVKRLGRKIYLSNMAKVASSGLAWMGFTLSLAVTTGSILEGRL